MVKKAINETLFFMLSTLYMSIIVHVCTVVVDELSHPVNIRFVLLPNNLTSIVLEWDTFSQATCSRDAVSYAVAIDHQMELLFHLRISLS